MSDQPRIKFFCPCGQKIGVPPERTGLGAICPACDRMLRVPASTLGPEQPAEEMWPPSRAPQAPSAGTIRVERTQPPVRTAAPSPPIDATLPPVSVGVETSPPAPPPPPAPGAASSATAPPAPELRPVASPPGSETMSDDAAAAPALAGATGVAAPSAAPRKNPNIISLFGVDVDVTANVTSIPEEDDAPAAPAPTLTAPSQASGTGGAGGPGHPAATATPMAGKSADDSDVIEIIDPHLDPEPEDAVRIEVGPEDETIRDGEVETGATPARAERGSGGDRVSPTPAKGGEGEGGARPQSGSRAGRPASTVRTPDRPIAAAMAELARTTARPPSAVTAPRSSGGGSPSRVAAPPPRAAAPATSRAAALARPPEARPSKLRAGVGLGVVALALVAGWFVLARHRTGTNAQPAASQPPAVTPAVKPPTAPIPPVPRPGGTPAGQPSGVTVQPGPGPTGGTPPTKPPTRPPGQQYVQVRWNLSDFDPPPDLQRQGETWLYAQVTIENRGYPQVTVGPAYFIYRIAGREYEAESNPAITSRFAGAMLPKIAVPDGGRVLGMLLFRVRGGGASAKGELTFRPIEGSSVAVRYGRD